MLLALVCLFIVPNAIVASLTFEEFVAHHSKTYASNEEYEIRKSIYNQNVHDVEKLKRLNPQASFDVNIPTADLTQEEYRSKNNGFKHGQDQLPSAQQYVTAADTIATTTMSTSNFKDLKIKKIDWRALGAVDPTVYYQGHCGACFAISVSQTVGSQYFLKHKLSKVPALSFQQIICCDCGGSDWGCKGGNPWEAYRNILNAGGLESYSEYPFTDYNYPSSKSCNMNKKCGKCAFKKADVAASITGMRNVTLSAMYGGNSNETLLAETLGSEGPISVCINTTPAWRYYRSGIITGAAGSTNHCVQLIGYDSMYKTPYWILKNSWGVQVSFIFFNFIIFINAHFFSYICFFTFFNIILLLITNENLFYIYIMDMINSSGVNQVT